MNLKNRKADNGKVGVEKISSEKLIENAFTDADSVSGEVDTGISILDVDTKDMDLSSEIEEFIDSLSPSTAADEIETESLSKTKEELVTTKKSEPSSKAASEFKKIHEANQIEFQSLLNDFKKQVEINDADNFEIKAGKPFLAKKFKEEGFTVTVTDGGFLIKF